ncbi:LuxR family transcriptional regulator [Sphingobium amiense]|uniref:LuxR family transcriptional regulator n=2 Tax=Sphingobium amiense TaxID=135719 RepID=A0A494W9X3_9SPHN|nr:helix-turn-helix transcriptional regulator [Sphingobium amiense]BBD99958.1 LuxR family transcriptional regulator [Sphingobium amiense]
MGKAAAILYDASMAIATQTSAPSGLVSFDGRLLDSLSKCVSSIGRDAFTDNFLEFVLQVGAAQVTAFSYEADRASCLLSRNFLSEEKGGTLAAAYVDGWFREDPLFRRARAMDDGECAVVRLESLLPELDENYVSMFFGAPGFRTKTAILVAQDSRRMILNLYLARDPRSASPIALDHVPAELYQLIGRMLATHFARLKPPAFPLPLAVLSERERQVCLGMLAGRKAEAIAEHIGVSANSVVTYRQRAYQKLGISSRGQLFSICHVQEDGASSA